MEVLATNHFMLRTLEQRSITAHMIDESGE